MSGSFGARLRLAGSLFAAVALVACGGGGGGGGADPAPPTPSPPPPPPPIVSTQAGMASTDGVVVTSALSADGRTLYIGGNFTHVGALTGSYVPVDAATGTIAAHPVFNGNIYQHLSDGAGGWYLSGDFTAVDTVAASGIVHVLADGRRDPAFTFGLHAGVGAMALAGGRLYFAQDAGLGAVDAHTGADSGWHASIDGAASRMIAVGGTVYVGGEFLGAAGVDRRNLAAFDGATGTLTAWNPAADNANALVEIDAMASAGSAILVGGRFVTAGGQPRTSVAALDPATGAALAWDARLDATQGALVDSIAVDGGTVYLGGGFQSVGGTPRASVAAVSAATGDLLPWDAGLNLGIYGGPFVSAVAVDGGSVYIAGNYFLPGETTTTRLAAFDKADAAPRPWIVANDNAPVTQMSVQGTQVVLSGNFSMLASPVRRGLAAIDTATDQPAAWNPALVNPDGNAALYVDKLVVAGDTVYAAGSFEQAGGVARKGFAAIDAATGAVLPWDPQNVGSVQSMAVNGSTLFIGGPYLTAAGGQARANLAAFDLASGQLLPWAPQLPPYSVVASLVATDERVYVAGSFDTVNGTSRAGLAAVDAQTGATLAWDPQVYSRSGTGIADMALAGGRLYLVGEIDSVAGQTRIGLAAVDAQDGSLSAWAPTAVVKPWAIAASGDRIYIANYEGGGFPPAPAVTTLSASLGTVVDTSRVVEGSVYTMTVAPNGLYLGGDFESSVGAPGGQYLALFSN